jgi:hypothetical protein
MSRSQPGRVLAAVAATLVAVQAANASFISTLGSPDFIDGQMPSLTEFEQASAGEPSPFNGLRGDDRAGGSNFSASWVHSFPAEPVTLAELTIGLQDHDSAASGEQVASFMMDSQNLTAVLNAALEARPGAQAQYRTYTVTIPPVALMDLADGTANFSLVLKPPGLQQGNPVDTETPNNAAGIDFSTLAINIPEPTSLCLIGFAGAGLLARRGRQR